MKPHAFVAMPFGVKKDNQGAEIDFNRVYTELIKHALEEAWAGSLPGGRRDARWWNS